MKLFFVKPYVLALFLFATTHTFGMFERIGQELDAMHNRMEIVFEELTEKTQMRKIEAPDYHPTVHEDGNNVIVSVQLAQDVTLENISVEVDEDVLVVIVQAKDRFELTISGQRMNITAQQNLEREMQDEHGHVYAVSSGSACMSQYRMLPVRVNFGIAPKADLADGVLTLTLAKKGPQKIAVTTSVQNPIIADDSVVQSSTREIVHEKVEDDHLNLDIENLK